MRLVCSAILVLAVATVASGANKLRDGFAVSLGIGDLYGGDAGVGLEYQTLLAPRLRLTPFVAAGVVSEQDRVSMAPGYCAGVNLEYGRWQRIFVNASFGSHYRDSDSLPEVKTRTMVGPALCLGYKGMARFGLFWQIGIGAAYIVNPVNNPNRVNTSLAPAFVIGLGYKP